MQSKSTDTTFTLNKLEYGQFTTSEHFGYLNAISACLQIITTVFSTAQIIVAIDQADQIFVVILAGLFQLYSAVIRYLYAITIIQQQNRITRVKGKHASLLAQVQLEMYHNSTVCYHNQLVWFLFQFY
ncbi:Hypothetical_protein [Hexamita inflata]|uniref:Hypothetical_protein n=1 Tax=Hexamita inflata TaxID=28002 RepID=A0AA86Q997_9EUKA|nr:Hypothetical protein HINF_LOCUS39417 [Hexamita inflata]